MALKYIGEITFSTVNSIFFCANVPLDSNWNLQGQVYWKKTNLGKMCKSRTTLGQVHETKFFKMNVFCQYVWTNWVNSNDYCMLHIVYSMKRCSNVALSMMHFKYAIFFTWIEWRYYDAKIFSNSLYQKHLHVHISFLN